jgi:hypothetical protein
MSSCNRWMVKMMMASFIAIVAAANAAQPALADDREKLLGIWKLVSNESEIQDTGELRPVYGKNPNGYIIFMPEGRMMTVITGEGRKVPKTDEERSAAWSTMIAYTGIYRIEGDKFITKVDVSWNEAWTGTEQIRFFKLDGNRLKVISGWAPTNNPNLGLGRMTRGILIWERVK